ncbi:MAG: phosphoribosylamine--glycine ligase, partial [Oscillospiraceae bacterium]|nr:phosphoribosylamine--glycine ligase [Oscillospiraceae bacterium]
ASGGYPEKYETGKPISGLDEKGQSPLAYVFHAGTKLKGGKYITAGGRVLGVTSAAADLNSALAAAYKAVESISFEKAHYRKDIGQKALKK